MENDTSKKQSICESVSFDTQELSKEWDKTFPKSEKVNHRKATFTNRYGITLAADPVIWLRRI